MPVAEGSPCCATKHRSRIQFLVEIFLWPPFTSRGSLGVCCGCLCACRWHPRYRLSFVRGYECMRYYYTKCYNVKCNVRNVITIPFPVFLNILVGHVLVAANDFFYLLMLYQVSNVVICLHYVCIHIFKSFVVSMIVFFLHVC